MRFRDAVINSNDVRDCYRVGLQALPEGDRNRLSCDDTRKISGSLHLDAAVAQLYANAARWDYGTGIKRTETADIAIWVEVHPADANQVQKIIDKLTWLKDWLMNSAPNLMSITGNDSPYVWIACGSVSFQRNSPQTKRLALAGIAFAQKHYRIPIS